jgi:hypothetical protein
MSIGTLTPAQEVNDVTVLQKNPGAVHKFGGTAVVVVVVVVVQE